MKVVNWQGTHYLDLQHSTWIKTGQSGREAWVLKDSQNIVLQLCFYFAFTHCMFNVLLVEVKYSTWGTELFYRVDWCVNSLLVKCYFFHGVPLISGHWQVAKALLNQPRILNHWANIYHVSGLLIYIELEHGHYYGTWLKCPKELTPWNWRLRCQSCAVILWCLTDSQWDECGSVSAADVRQKWEDGGTFIHHRTDGHSGFILVSVCKAFNKARQFKKYIFSHFANWIFSAHLNFTILWFFTLCKIKNSSTGCQEKEAYSFLIVKGFLWLSFGF